MWEEILEKVKAFLLHDQNNRMKIKKKVVVDERCTWHKALSKDLSLIKKQGMVQEYISKQ